MERLIIVGGAIIGLLLFAIGAQGVIRNANETRFFDKATAVVSNVWHEAFSGGGGQMKKIIAEISLDDASTTNVSTDIATATATAPKVLPFKAKEKTTNIPKPEPTELVQLIGPTVLPPVVAEPIRVVIAEIQTTGGVGSSTSDFIRLYNMGREPANLKGYRLVKRAKTTTKDTSIKSWTTDAFIPAHGVYIWANSDLASSTIIHADVVTSATIANDNGIALRHGAENVGEIIDAVAWGAAQNTLFEGTPFSKNPAAGQILKRKIVGDELQDTHNNAADFELR